MLKLMWLLDFSSNQCGSLLVRWCMWLLDLWSVWCGYSIDVPADTATKFLLYSNVLWCYQWNSCNTRMHFGAINEIPVILECTLVLSMRFLLYSNVLWCYQWDSCYTRRYFGVINEIPVILECTLVLSMRFLVYSNVLWCYQWDSCYIRGYYFGAINVLSSMKRQLPKNSISVVIDLAFGNGCDKETQYRSINSATVVYVYGSQGDICHVI